MPTKVPVCRPPSGSCRPKRVGLIRIIWAQGHQLTHFPLSPVFAPSHLSLAKSGGGSVGGPEAGPEGKGMAEPTCSAGMELGRAQGHPDIPLLRPVWRRNEEKDKQARSKHHPDTNSGTLCLVEKLTPKHYPCNTNVSAKSMDRRRSHQAAYWGVYMREREWHFVHPCVHPVVGRLVLSRGSALCTRPCRSRQGSACRSRRAARI